MAKRLDDTKVEVCLGCTWPMVGLVGGHDLPSELFLQWWTW